MAQTPTIELLFWRECPSWSRALAELRDAVRDEGLDPNAINVREIDTDEMAEREQFVGSPTVRVNGRDVKPPGDDEPLGLTCRIYHLRDGGVSPVPDRVDVREAIERAAAATASERS